MCPVAKIYWRIIHQEITKILRYNIPKAAEIFLLLLNLENIKDNDKTILWYVILVAGILYVHFWRKAELSQKEQ